MRTVLLLSLLLVTGCGGVPSVPPAAATKDPYPECAEIRRKLREASGEPDKLEIVSWGPRGVWGKPVPKPRPVADPGSEPFSERARLEHWEGEARLAKEMEGTVTIEVKYRDTNAFGARQVMTQSFSFRPKGKKK